MPPKVTQQLNSARLLERSFRLSEHGFHRAPVGGTSHNGRETLGLRPALRQAAPERRRGRGGEERQRRGNGRSHNKPLRGLPAGVCSPLPQCKAGAACLRDIPLRGTSSPAGRSVKETLPPSSSRRTPGWPLGEHQLLLTSGRSKHPLPFPRKCAYPLPGLTYSSGAKTRAAIR